MDCFSVPNNEINHPWFDPMGFLSEQKGRFANFGANDDVDVNVCNFIVVALERLSKK